MPAGELSLVFPAVARLRDSIRLSASVPRIHRVFRVYADRMDFWYASTACLRYAKRRVLIQIYRSTLAIFLSSIFRVSCANAAVTLCLWFSVDFGVTPEQRNLKILTEAKCLYWQRIIRKQMSQSNRHLFFCGFSTRDGRWLAVTRVCGRLSVDRDLA